MRPPKHPNTHRTPGALQALCLTVLVFSLGLFGAGAQESDQSSASGFSETFEPVVGAPSASGLSALPNWLRQAAEGTDGGEDSFAAIGAAFSEAGYSSLPKANYSSPVFSNSPHQLSHSPRAPPLV